ncbi:hypothetical protein VE03_04343 [Pseudogymnoascus sp. 23342-1-I1]|nr:hypothetical protein VE03_04343 [Pseudogymnoascus sp. 23342-1-I1]
MMASRWPLAVSLALLPLAWAQSSGWVEGEANTTMCQWTLPRVGVIRDTLYIDGGQLYWQPTLKDGKPAELIQDEMNQGLIYTLNFSTPFTTSTNFSSILTPLPVVLGASNNIAPVYYDGALLANDAEFLSYGGLLLGSALLSPPGPQDSLGYEAYNLGPADRKFSPGFIQKTITSGVTRYVGFGSGVSVPSENRGFYFGGMQAKGRGEVYMVQGSATTDPTIYSNDLIDLDMSAQLEEVWSKHTIPATVPGRASPEVVWVPVGEKGVLVVVGGVVNPVFTNASYTLTDAQMAESQTKSPAFLSTVSIYDIATSSWFQQPTTSPPTSTAWTQGCTVVASAPDGSSHNIYYYGGFDGISLQSPFNDEVWILSLPSFTWVKAATGRTGHGRAGHRCVKPYPDQMIVLGGYPANGGTALGCVGGGIVQLFNLSSLEWVDTYDPRVWSNYTVPSIVTAAIASAGTTKFSNASLSAIFKTPYDTTKITPWYPYAYTDTSTTTPTPPDVPSATPVPAPSSGTPKWLAPVLGVVLTLVVLSALAIAFLLYRRRRYLRRRDSVADTSEVNRNRILSWVWGHDGKSGGTVTSDETPTTTAFDDDAVGPREGRHLSTGTVPSVHVVEAGGSMVHELPDTSQMRVELSAADEAGLTYVPIAGGGLHPSPSVASTSSRSSELSAEGTPKLGSAALSAAGSGVDSPGRGDSPGGLGKGELDGGVAAGERRRSGPVTPRSERFGSLGSLGSEGGLSATGGLSPNGGSEGGGTGQTQARRKSAFGEMLDEK